jgi:hypothetical protein
MRKSGDLPSGALSLGSHTASSSDVQLAVSRCICAAAAKQAAGPSLVNTCPGPHRRVRAYSPSQFDKSVRQVAETGLERTTIPQGS